MFLYDYSAKFIFGLVRRINSGRQWLQNRTLLIICCMYVVKKYESLLIIKNGTKGFQQELAVRNIYASIGTEFPTFCQKRSVIIIKSLCSGCPIRATTCNSESMHELSLGTVYRDRNYENFLLNI